MVVGRRNLDEIGPNQVEGAKAAQHHEGLARGGSAGDGGAGARRKGRIEAINVEGNGIQVGLLGLGTSRDSVCVQSKPRRVNRRNAPHDLRFGKN